MRVRDMALFFDTAVRVVAGGQFNERDREQTPTLIMERTGVQSVIYQLHSKSGT